MYSIIANTLVSLPTLIVLQDRCFRYKLSLSIIYGLCFRTLQLSKKYTKFYRFFLWTKIRQQQGYLAVITDFI